MAEKIHCSYRKRSREDWGQTQDPREGLCIDQIRLGCELRSADALERISTILDTINSNLCGIRWDVESCIKLPAKTKREIQNLKKIIRQQKEEITKLKST
jgi:hypothetical protein